MDLVQTVRKEGSRGGRGDFKWEDVKTSAHRENYLGHSVMAPVGRWQKNKDLTWYAKGDGQSEADARREEIKKIKEAEEAARAAALGLPPPTKAGEEANANMVPLGAPKGEDESREPQSKDRSRRRRSRSRDRGERRSHRDRSRDREGSRREHRHRSRDRRRERSRDRSPRRRHHSRSRDPSRERRRHRSHRERREEDDDRRRRRHARSSRSKSPN